jgi:hypothetical protein
MSKNPFAGREGWLALTCVLVIGVIGSVGIYFAIRSTNKSKYVAAGNPQEQVKEAPKSGRPKDQTPEQKDQTTGAKTPQSKRNDRLEVDAKAYQTLESILANLPDNARLKGDGTDDIRRDRAKDWIEKHISGKAIKVEGVLGVETQRESEGKRYMVTITIHDHFLQDTPAHIGISLHAKAPDVAYTITLEMKYGNVSEKTAERLAALDRSSVTIRGVTGICDCYSDRFFGGGGLTLRFRDFSLNGYVPDIPTRDD